MIWWNTDVPDTSGGEYRKVSVFDLKIGDVFVLDGFYYKVTAPLPKKTNAMVFHVLTYSHELNMVVEAQVVTDFSRHVYMKNKHIGV